MRLFLLTALLALLLLTWWALHPPGSTGKRSLESSEKDRIDYFVRNLDLTTYDASGLPLRHLRAAALDHLEHSGKTLLTRPRLLLFEEGSLLWDVRSEKGTLSGDRQLLQLHGEVLVDRMQTPGLPAMQLQTRELQVNPQESYAETDQPVTVTSEENWIRARGMQAWLRPPGRIRFLANTRAYYVTQ